MGSKNIKQNNMKNRLLLLALLFIPFIGFSQVGVRAADTALVTTVGGSIQVWKSKNYYNNAFGLYRKLNNNIFTGNLSTTKNAPVFFEFENTNSPGNTKASLGALGNGGEANVSWNMDYTTGVHKYYDSTYNAMWLAVGSDVWAMQYAQAGTQTGDVWNNTGAKYLIWGDNTGKLVLNSSAAANKGDAKLVINRESSFASLSGNSDLIISGNKTKGTTGIVYINPYDSGNILLGSGTGRVGIKTLSPGFDLDVNGTINSSANVSGNTMSSTLGVTTGRTAGLPSIRGITDLVVEGNTTSGRLYLNHYSSGQVDIATGGGGIKIGTGIVKSDSAIKVSRNSGLATIMGVGDIVVDGGATTGSDVYLNRYSSGNVILNLAGGFTGVGLTPSVPMHVKGQVRAARANNNAQYAQIDMEAGAATVLSKNTTNATYPQIFISQGNNVADRVVLSADGNGKIAIPLGASLAIAPTAATDIVRKTELDLKANIASPVFTGIPTAPTATAGTNTLQLATTAFVQGAVTAVITTGTYIPTFTSVSNTSAITNLKAYYVRTGNIVQVTARFNATPVTGADIQITMTLPVSTTYASINDVMGIVQVFGNPVPPSNPAGSGSVSASNPSGSTTTCIIQAPTPSLTGNAYTVKFTYEVK